MADAPEPPKDIQTPFDVRKLMTEFDPSKLMSEFQNMLKQYKLPGVDIEALVSSQKKNVEAVLAANRIAVEGMQAIAKRQAEVFQEAMREAQQAVSSMTKASFSAGSRRQANGPDENGVREERVDNARDGGDTDEI